MLFSDEMLMDGQFQLTSKGFLVANARISRDGIYDYWGPEIGINEDRIVKVYRSTDEVFNRDSMSSFARVPVTLGHPPVLMTADNWKKYAVGEVDSQNLGRVTVESGEYFNVPLIVKASDAIEAVKKGEKELSCGYDCQIEIGEGIAPCGTQYDARQRQIIGDHVAIVPRGRAGAQACIDGQFVQPRHIVRPSVHQVKKDVQGEKPVDNVTIDGMSVPASSAQQFIDKALKERDDKLAEAKDTLAQAETKLKDLQSQVEKLQGSVDEKDNQLKELEGAVPKDQLEAELTKLDSVRTKAKEVAPKVDLKGLDADEIVRKVVEARKGADAVKDKSSDYLRGIFDDMKVVRKQTTTSSYTTTTEEDDAAGGTPTEGFDSVTDESEKARLEMIQSYNGGK